MSTGLERAPRVPSELAGLQRKEGMRRAKGGRSERGKLFSGEELLYLGPIDDTGGHVKHLLQNCVCVCVCLGERPQPSLASQGVL